MFALSDYSICFELIYIITRTQRLCARRSRIAVSTERNTVGSSAATQTKNSNWDEQYAEKVGENLYRTSRSNESNCPTKPLSHPSMVFYSCAKQKTKKKRSPGFMAKSHIIPPRLRRYRRVEAAKQGVTGSLFICLLWCTILEPIQHNKHNTTFLHNGQQANVMLTTPCARAQTSTRRPSTRPF